jgi:hypothetical protein
MNTDGIRLYAGTAGHSAWFSNDLGESWTHPNSHSGMYTEARVWCMSSHPSDADVLWAGSDMGLFRWLESTARWEPVPSPMQDVWAIAQDPENPSLMIAGTRPGGLYRSTDAGLTWTVANVPGVRTFSEVNKGPTRVTQVLFDPVDRGASRCRTSRPASCARSATPRPPAFPRCPTSRRSPRRCRATRC